MPATQLKPALVAARRRSAADPAEAQRASGTTKVFANLFFLFFAWQIFSPSYFGVTVYLECVVAACNPDFWRWLSSLKIRRAAVFGLTLLCAAYLFSDLKSAVSEITTVLTVMYLVYSIERRAFYLFRYLAVSMLLALVQHYYLVRDPKLALDLGPTHLAHLVWGAHATGTYSNFYAAVGSVARVSGLSREGGFFAALLVVAICAYVILRGRSKLYFLLLAAAYYVSLSKMSFVLLPLAAVIRWRKQLDAVPWVLLMGIYATAVWIFASTHRAFLLDPRHGTYLDRFGSSLLYTSLTTKQWLSGATLAQVDSPIARLMTQEQGVVGSGISGYILHEGLITVSLFLVALHLLGIRGSGVLILCFATMDLDFRTSQNFVSIAYFLALYLVPRMEVLRDPLRGLSPLGLARPADVVSEAVSDAEPRPPEPPTRHRNVRGSRARVRA